ncbi:hypothetical protein BgiBS90_024097, partial [Biomphalaria glabrata]
HQWKESHSSSSGPNVDLVHCCSRFRIIWSRNVRQRTLELHSLYPWPNSTSPAFVCMPMKRFYVASLVVGRAKATLELVDIVKPKRPLLHKQGDILISTSSAQTHDQVATPAISIRIKMGKKNTENET